MRQTRAPASATCRPGGSGSLRAWAFTLASAGLFVPAAWNLNRLAFALAPVALAVVWSYSWTKRFTWASHLWLGVSLALAPLGAWIAVRGRLDVLPLLLGLGANLKVTLASHGPLADAWSDSARTHVLTSLQRLGVRVEQGLRIRAVHERRLETDRGDMAFDLCLWCGGFVAHPLGRSSALAVNERGQAVVDAQLQSISHPFVHVAGELAAFAAGSRVRMPMGCKSALPTGAWAAENIARSLGGLPQRPFEYGVPFFCVSLGRRDGLIQMSAPDASMRGRVLTGRRAAWFKELICRATMWALQLERIGVSGVQWVRQNDDARASSGEALSQQS